MIEVRAPLAGSVVSVEVGAGASIGSGDTLLVIESMKMEHELRAPAAGEVASVRVRAGDVIAEGDLLLSLRTAAMTSSFATTATPAPDTVATAAPPPAATLPLRADLIELNRRLALTADAARPEAIAKRHALGLRSARENVADLCDDGSFVEYGALAFAAQERRRSRDDLIRATPADGIVTGIGRINGAAFGPERSRAVVMAYDATVLAGTQGLRNHQKTDRMLGLALEQKLPVVLFAEGGGGRPGDVDSIVVAGLNVPTFASFARLSGRVPLIGVVAGRCFAGNAALLGCCDVIIATRGASIGMGGPAMVEGGGLGRFRPEDIGPAELQSRVGTVDVLVENEAEAIAVARRYLAMFQGRTEGWRAGDPARLRELLPANRLRVYEIRTVIEALADEGSTIELRAGFGAGIVTALIRLEGRPVGVMASNPAHLGGAIDADAADKAARFLQLCDAHGLPVVSLVDTPGFMVGPEIEARAQVRHVSRMFVVAARMAVPVVAVVLRKAYGLGAMAMAAGGLHAPLATAAWPSGEFGAMGLEGAVELGFRKELEAVTPGVVRDALRERLIADQYEKGSALNLAATLEIDAVIDPAETRQWLVLVLESAAPVVGSGRFVDPW